jgi:hypothetical protein
MRGGDGERAAVLPAEFLPDLFQVAGVVQYALRDTEHRLARLGQGADALAVAHEYLDPQLFLQQFDLFADPRLRGVERLRRI